VASSVQSTADLRAGPFLLLLPLLLVTVLFVIVPLAVFFVYSFMTGALFAVALPLTIDAYESAVSSGLNRSLAWNSMAIGFMTAAITTAIGLAVAYWLRYRAGRLQIPVLFLVTASIFASYLVRIYAWRTILGRSGLINSGLIEAGLIGEPLEFLLYNWFSVVVALVHIFLPYVVLVLFAAFRPLAPDYLETAQDLGATAWARWQRVILPLMAAPTATAFLFVFILSASDFVTPQLIGGTGGQLLGVQIQSNFKAIGNWPLGAATSILMLLFFLVCYAVVQLALRTLKLDRIRWS
jgi:spermidine/putrescine transport system permease protein